MVEQTRPVVHWTHIAHQTRVQEAGELPDLLVNVDVDASANDVDSLENREITVPRGSQHVCPVEKAYGLKVNTVHEQMPL